MADVRAYPFDRWPRLTRAQAEELRRHARAGPSIGLVRGAAASEGWLGVRTAFAFGTFGHASLPLDPDPLVAVLLERGDGAREALLLAPPIASALVDRAVGGDGEELQGANGALSQTERGVLAYVLARWLADGDSDHSVLAILTRAPALALALGEGPFVRWAIELTIGELRGRAALYRPASASTARRRVLPAWARALEVELPLVAGCAVLSARALAELEIGDVVLLDFDATSAQLVGAHRSWRTKIDGALVRIEHEELSLPLAQDARLEATMKDADRLLDKVGDTPVTLTLELVRFALSLEEVAALAPGEVLRTGRPIGERVSLRAGERVVAIGELVDVEGELGVRILELPR